jgi:hypothetical protein
MLTFIRWNVENEDMSARSFFNKDGFFINDQKGPAHLKILVHYWGKQKAYWGKCPSSYILLKNALQCR